MSHCCQYLMSATQIPNVVLCPVPCRNGKKNKPLLNVQVNGGGNGWEDSPSRSPLLSARSPCILPNTLSHLGDPAGVRSKCFLVNLKFVYSKT